jgi:uncharacterized protein YbaP (TraB family)
MADYHTLSIKRCHCIVIAFFLSLLVVLAVGSFAQQNRTASPHQNCLWVVRTSANSLYLLGSLHLLKSSAYPLAAEIEEAYSTSQKIVFETDIGAMMDSTVQLKMLELGLYPEGQDLFQIISGRTRKIIEAKLKDLGLPPSYFSRFKPWFLAVTLTTLELQRLDFNPQYGIDLHFYTRARTDQKELAYLETVEFQLDLLGNMTAQDQQEFLNQTLKDLAVSAELADEMMSAWQKGDTDRLYNTLFKSFQGHPGIEDRLLTRRNRNWIRQIRDMLKVPKNTMVIVGAGHLLGPHGIVEILRQEGYEVKQQ